MNARVLTPLDAYRIAQYLAGAPSIDLDGLSCDVARQVAHALLSANGRDRSQTLEDFLVTISPATAFAIHDAIRAADPNGPEPTEPESRPYQLYSLADAFATEDDEPDWLVDQVVQRGCTTALVGGPGGKKTWAGLDLAICVATGKEWLNFPVQQGRVLVVRRG